MTSASLCRTAACLLVLASLTFVGAGSGPAQGASITLSDTNCVRWDVAGPDGAQTLTCVLSGNPAPPTTLPPSGCVVTPSPSSLSVAGPVNLSVSCSGGNAATSYAWTASPATGFANGSSTTFGSNSATIS